MLKSISTKMNNRFIKKYTFWFLSAVFYLLPSSFSYSNEQWITSRNIYELEKIVQIQKRKKKLKILCQLQLNKKIIPWACYEWLKKKPREKKKFFLSYLNEKCAEFSIYLKTSQEIKRILQQKNLSRFCRKTINKRKSIIEYRLRDRPPSDILNWYFTEDF